LKVGQTQGRYHKVKNYCTEGKALTQGMCVQEWKPYLLWYGSYDPG